MTVLLPDLIILDYRQGLGSVPLSSVLAGKFPVIKQLLVAEKDCARLRDIRLTRGEQVILSKGCPARGLIRRAGADFGGLLSGGRQLLQGFYPIFHSADDLDAAEVL